MTLIVVVVLVVAITTLFTLFVRAKDIPPPDPVSPTQHLEDRKAAIYENLRDLQFEYRVGKLSDTDYQQTKLTLQKELAGVLSSIDRIAPPSPARQTAAPRKAQPERAQPEKAPPEKNQPEKIQAAAAPNPEASVEAAAGNAPASSAAYVCPHCAAEFPKPMKFCGECGKAMGSACPHCGAEFPRPMKFCGECGKAMA